MSVSEVERRAILRRMAQESQENGFHDLDVSEMPPRQVSRVSADSVDEEP